MAPVNVGTSTSTTSPGATQHARDQVEALLRSGRHQHARAAAPSPLGAPSPPPATRAAARSRASGRTAASAPSPAAAPRQSRAARPSGNELGRGIAGGKGDQIGRRAATVPMRRMADSWSSRPVGERKRSTSLRAAWPQPGFGLEPCGRPPRPLARRALGRVPAIERRVGADRRQPDVLQHDAAQDPGQQLQRQHGEPDERHERDQPERRRRHERGARRRARPAPGWRRTPPPPCGARAARSRRAAAAPLRRRSPPRPSRSAPAGRRRLTTVIQHDEADRRRIGTMPAVAPSPSERVIRQRRGPRARRPPSARRRGARSAGTARAALR